MSNIVTVKFIRDGKTVGVPAGPAPAFSWNAGGIRPGV